jgi:Protein of unknown function (DUF2721)
MPIASAITSDALEGTAHIVQVALTPIFLLTGAATLLNVFNTRLARVSDHHEHMAELLRAGPEAGERRLLLAHEARLRHRLLALDAAVSLSALGAAATCGTAFILFQGGVQDRSDANWPVLSFGFALLCVVAGLMAFLADTALAWHGLRQEGAMPRPKK